MREVYIFLIAIAIIFTSFTLWYEYRNDKRFSKYKSDIDKLKNKE